jgi:dTMP kinase
VNRGFFISIEGLDGAGKSTQHALLAKHLAENGEKVLPLREPGATDVGEKIRAILKDKTFQHPPAAEVELLLFLASRAQLVRERIMPALQSGYVVLCDRFIDSTIAYQCGGRGISSKSISALHRFASGGLVPDLTILLDLAPEEGFRRINIGRKTALDRIEEQSMDFFRRVHKSYGRIAIKNPQRVVVLDGSLPPDSIGEKVRTTVCERIYRFRNDVNRSMRGPAI